MPRGANHLAVTGIADWLHESVHFVQERGDWWAHLFLVMPDHIHALLSFARDADLRRSVTEWKRYAARMKGICWQRDFFEHRLRNDENQVEKAHYIRMNPVRGKLVDCPEDWPFVWPRPEPDPLMPR